MKKTILVDLDGVLNNYSGDYDENYIPEIKNGAVDFLKELSTNFAIKIFTTRNYYQAQKWVSENKIAEYINDITNTKEPCFLIIDDRCIKFNGNYNQILSEIYNFKVWYK